MSKIIRMSNYFEPPWLVHLTPRVQKPNDSGGASWMAAPATTTFASFIAQRTGNAWVMRSTQSISRCCGPKNPSKSANFESGLGQFRYCVTRLWNGLGNLSGHPCDTHRGWAFRSAFRWGRGHSGQCWDETGAACVARKISWLDWEISGKK